jgi:hypothetical protein
VHASARGEVERMRTGKHAEVFAVIALDPQKRGFREHWWLEQRICQKPRRVQPISDDKISGIEGWRLGGHGHEVSILIIGVGGLA